MPRNEVNMKGPIQSVSRAAAILRCFFGVSELSLQEISQQVGLHKSTTSTLVATLKNEGFLEQDPQTSKYRLGMTAFLLGANASIDLSTIAQPFLQSLSGRFHETVNLAAPYGSDIIYLNKIDSAHSMRTCTQIGHCLPFYCTANGKSIFAYYPESALDAIFDQLSFQQFTEHTISDKDRLRKELAEARRNGYAFDSEELEAGLCCYAAPIFDYTNYPTAAISVSGPCFRMEGSLRSEIIPALQRSAQQITDLLVQSHYISSRNAG